MSEPIRGIVVAHADLGRALIEAVDRIVGLEDGALVAISNEGLGPEGIRRQLGAAVTEHPTLVFTDLREGSCGLAARHLCREHDQYLLLTGVNLPMLLDFAMNRHRPLHELAERVLERGTGAIQWVGEAEEP